jgi:hypothetical protein
MPAVWYLFGAGMASSFAGDVTNAIYDVVFGNDASSSSVADVC